MKKSVFVVLFLCAAMTLFADGPKYIFLFIGDGMATPQRMIGEEFSRKIGRGKLVMNTLPHHATTRTASANALITDSAAAATAIACGEKTNNGMVGVDPQQNILISVAEKAHKNGKKVGIISSVPLNHATPAGFYGHRRSRGMCFELGCDLVDSGFEFFGGGGILALQKNGKNILDMAKSAGYKVVSGKAGMDSLNPGEKAILFAKHNDRQMPYAMDSDDVTPTLADITAKAIEMLDNPNGFFIMTEGGAIDWAGHANESAANLYDVLALDDAVKTALKFYEKHPTETLIIVTGDHETGAMTMGFSGSGYNMKLELLTKQKCSIDVFGKKLKAAESESKDFDFEAAQKLLEENFGLKFSGDIKDPMFVNDKELTRLKNAFKAKQLPNAVRILMNSKAGIGWNSGNHTALPVLTTSIGCKAEIFTGFIENTDISKKIKSVL